MGGEEGPDGHTGVSMGPVGLGGHLHGDGWVPKGIPMPRWAPRGVWVPCPAPWVHRGFCMTFVASWAPRDDPAPCRTRQCLCVPCGWLWGLCDNVSTQEYPCALHDPASTQGCPRALHNPESTHGCPKDVVSTQGCPHAPPSHLALGRADEGDISPGFHPLHPLLLHGDGDGLGGCLCTEMRGLSPVPCPIPCHPPTATTAPYR